MEMHGFWHRFPILYLLVIRPTWLECADVYVLQLAIYEHETIDAVCASRGPRGRAVPSHSVRHAIMVDNLEGFFALCH